MINIVKVHPTICYSRSACLSDACHVIVIQIPVIVVHVGCMYVLDVCESVNMIGA